MYLSTELLSIHICIPLMNEIYTLQCAYYHYRLFACMLRAIFMKDLQCYYCYNTLFAMVVFAVCLVIRRFFHQYIILYTYSSQTQECDRNIQIISIFSQKKTLCTHKCQTRIYNISRAMGEKCPCCCCLQPSRAHPNL